MTKNVRQSLMENGQTYNLIINFTIYTMNKNLLFGMVAATGMLLATSCTNDELDGVRSGNECVVSFTLEQPSISTRAYSDGLTANTLTYAVYESGETEALITSEDEVKFSNKTATVNLRLVTGKSYDILFWADRDADGSGDIYYDAKYLNSVKVVGLDAQRNVNYVSGDDRDAFCGVLRKQTFAAGTALNVTLTRPLARVVVTNATELTSEMKVLLTATGIPTGYNVLTGESLTESAAGDLTITYPNATPSQSEIFTDYFFPPATGSTISGTLTAGSHTQQLTLTSDDIVANYTTNITLNLN